MNTPVEPGAGDEYANSRFVVLHHQYSDGESRLDHWDLMFETPTGLLTWALDACPALSAWIPAIELPIHRELYLDYEGPISGDRGMVTRKMSGRYRWESEPETSDAFIEFEDQRWRVEFRKTETEDDDGLVARLNIRFTNTGSRDADSIAPESINQ